MNELLAAVGLDDGAIELVVSGSRALTLVIRRSEGTPRRCVVRVHRGLGENRVAHEHQVLVSLRARAPASFALTVPAPLARASFGPGEAVVLGFLEGTPLAPARSVVELRGQLEQVRIWLADLWSIRPPEAQGERYSCATILESLELEVAAAGPRVASSWAKVRAAARELDVSPAVDCHFDLSPSNVLGSRSGIRVVDWEYARRGHPLYDWLRFVVQMGLAWRSRPPDLSRRLDHDDLVLGPVRRLFFDPGPLAEVVATETLAALALARLDLARADAMVRAALLQYLAPQIPWQERGAVIETILARRSVISRYL